MANVTILNGTSSTVGGAALYTATTNCRIILNFVHATSAGDEITMRWGNSVNYNQVSSTDVHALGRRLAHIYVSNDDTRSDYFCSRRFTKGLLPGSDIVGMTTTMAYPLELYLKSGEIFDLTCDAYSIMIVTE
jgi:hypothetical protein